MRVRSPIILPASVKLLPMTELASLKGPIASVPEFMPSCLRIGPFTTIMFAIELVELPKEDAWVSVARMVGKYSGFAPAMTAIIAAFSTVSSREPNLLTTSSGLWLVPLSIAATLSSVGSMIGLKSVHSFSLNRRCRLASVSGFSSLGSMTAPGRHSLFLFFVGKRLGKRIDDRLHHRLAAQEIFPLDVALVHRFRLAGDGKGERDIPDGHAVGVLQLIILEFHDVDTGGAYSGDFGKFEIPCKSAHGRYAAMSTTNPDDHPGSLFVDDLLPKSGIVAERIQPPWISVSPP